MTLRYKGVEIAEANNTEFFEAEIKSIIDSVRRLNNTHKLREAAFNVIRAINESVSIDGAISNPVYHLKIDLDKFISETNNLYDEAIDDMFVNFPGLSVIMELIETPYFDEIHRYYIDKKEDKEGDNEEDKEMDDD